MFFGPLREKNPTTNGFPFAEISDCNLIYNYLKMKPKPESHIPAVAFRSFIKSAGAVIAGIAGAGLIKYNCRYVI